MDKNSEYIHSTTKKLVKAESRIVTLETNCKRLQEVCLDKDARIAELESAHQWISVEDRLPIPDRTTVLYSEHEDVFIGYLCLYSNVFKDQFDRILDEDDVTHWQQISPPEPKT